ncbi:MAG: YCF48-related protein, partial [Planctomycetota bacterium]|nr:YCF48-related protein [Planctomycetota bacterium]
MPSLLFRLNGLFFILLFNPAGDCVNVDAQEPSFSLKWQYQTLNTTAHLRGLHVVNRDQVWASGSQGTVIQTQDGGQRWRIEQIGNAKAREFRDIQGFSDGTAQILAAGNPALIFRYQPQRQQWINTYRKTQTGIFFDAFGYWDRLHGIAFSDPIKGRLVLIQTADGGESWMESASPPTVDKHEAGFAASGTCLHTQGSNRVWIGLGGKPESKEKPFARVLFSIDRGISWKAAPTTITRSESSGVFSITFINQRLGFAVGGD